MKSKQNATTFQRVSSLLLALVLVLGLLPVSPHAHAAETVKLTNSKGEETNTFEVGEPVFMEITGLGSDRWVDLWYVKPDGGYESTYRLYWYVPEGKVNLWEGVWSNDAGFWEGMNMPTGTYELYLEGGSVLATFTLVAPADTSTKTLELVNDTVTLGEPLQINAVNYSEYSWVGVYAGGHYTQGAFPSKSTAFFYCLGHNGLTMEYNLGVGEYTIAMFNDYDGNQLQKILYATVKEGETEVLSTDKKEYKYGEPILVNAIGGGKDWVGLYKKGETYNPDAGGVKSIFWYYISEESTTNVDILKTRNENFRSEEYIAGEYTIVLFRNDSYTPEVTVDIVVTTEIDESKTVTVPATCEKDGSVTYYNTDGTVADTETLPKTGHDYETIRPKYDAENGQHTLVCANDETHTKTENCTWDDGVVTKEPTGEEKGIREFTCTVCGGTRTEEISAKTVDHEEVTKEPTCEEPGTKVIYYTDGTSEEVEIPKLNHAYPEKFTYDGAEKKTHSKVCANDEKHVITETCSFESSAISGGKRYTCTVCGGTYDEIVLSTDKAEYALGEPIMVTVNTEYYSETEKDWVGIWEQGKTYSDAVSIYYHYPDELGYTANIYDGIYQRDSIAVGHYTIRLFANDGYDQITSLDIYVGPAVVKETVETPPTCEEDGYVTEIYTDGSKVVKTADELGREDLKATGHAYPEKFTSNEDGKTHSKVCANDEKHVISEDCTWDAGKVTKEPTTEETGIKTYTCTVCEGIKTEELPKVNVTEVSRETKAPTCTQEGYTLITYSDGSIQKVDTKSPLGHDYEGVTWTHVEGTRTHTATCTRNCGEEGATAIRDCTLETNALRQDWALFYSCPACGDWYEPIILTNKKVYAYGEQIMITVHPDFHAGATDWIGLYKVGEAPNQEKNPTSIYWGYTKEFPSDMSKSIFDASHHDRDIPIAAGEYYLYLCINDGYEIKGRVLITVTAEETKRETTKPTCTEDGYITAYYSDGTSKVVATAAEDPTLKATGHAYPDTWTPVAGERKHSRACANDSSHVEYENCSWDAGKVTKEPEDGQVGIKTYTCTVCGNTYTEEFSNATEVSNVITKAATCEEDGLRTITYSDGTVAEIVLPKLGHNWSDWVYNNATKTHTKTCANADHPITENCSFGEGTVSGTQVNFSCSICGGGYSTGLLVTDKELYGVKDPIMVTVYDTYANAWVGLYKEGEMFDPESGGVESMFWTYITEDMVGKPFDLTAVTVGISSGHRGEKLSNGNYVLYFFGDGGYSNVVDSVELKVFTDISNTEFTIQLNGEKLSDGQHVDLEKDDPVKLTTSAVGETGTSWVAVYPGKLGADMEFRGIETIHWHYISDENGEELDLASMYSGKFAHGEFTIVLFGGGSYDDVRMIATFGIKRPTVSETIIQKATCTRPGMKKVVYVDDNNPDTDEEVTVIIFALGHDWSDWTCNAGEGNHTRTCKREDCGTAETEDCVFEAGKCTACGGVEHIHATTKVEAKKATCVADGNIEYYTCACGQWFTDAEATKVITDKQSVVTTDKDNHAYGQWVYDLENRKHTATCANDPAHTVSEDCTFGEAVVIKNAVGNNAGLKQYTCSECKGTYTEEYFAEPTEGTYDRVQGATRYDTAIAAAEQLKKNLGFEKFSAIVVASGTEFADALSGSYLANQKNAPILLVRNNKNDLAKVKEYIKANLVEGGIVYLLGGEKAVPKSMESGLEGYTVKRLYGATRYETNLAILKEAGAAGKEVLVCTGKEFADGLSASAVNKPILLVKDKLTDAQLAFLKEAGGKFYIIGGDKAINTRIETALKGIGETERVSGSDRYATSVAVAKKFFNTTKFAVLAYGKNFPDALSAGPLAYSMGTPLLLTAAGKTAAAQTYVKETGIVTGSVIGGSAVLSDKVANAIFK